MATIQIKHRYTNAVLFECEAPESLESGLAMRHALEKAVIAKANLSGANLSYANLSGANLSYAYLSGAYLSDANLSYANLSYANLSGANLSYAYLSGAYLSDANLSYANLSGAYLSDANLSDANLSDANLSYANLSGANLSYAYLSGAYLSDANLSGAYLRDGKKLIGSRPFFAIGPIGSRSDYLQAYITDGELMIRAGCFLDTRSKFELALVAEHGDNEHAQEYLAALVLIDKHAELWTPKVESVEAAEEEVTA